MIKRHATLKNTGTSKSASKKGTLKLPLFLVGLASLSLILGIGFSTPDQSSHAQASPSDNNANLKPIAQQPVTMTASTQPSHGSQATHSSKSLSHTQYRPEQTIALAQPLPQASLSKAPFSINKTNLQNTQETAQKRHLPSPNSITSVPKNNHKIIRDADWKKQGIRPTNVKRRTIKSGESMAKVFKSLNFSAATLHKIMSANKNSHYLSNLQPHQEVLFAIDDANTLLGLSLKIDSLKTLWIIRSPEKNPNTFTFNVEKQKLEVKVASASGIIKRSLFLAGQEAGLSEKTIMELANIFGWDIDFALDIREGDHFSILYEQNFLDGKKHSSGNILAAEFTNAAKTFTAIRYKDPDGRISYYSKDGYNMRKAFLRSPVDFARISSHFNLKRRHPILHTIRAHKGVDYAAGRGTPIKAVGDGKVIHAGKKGGYGRTVILKHGKKYTTLYAHMTRYAKGISTGKRVTQGQIIGYVGSSGLATGPHLHYEFRTNGVHVNPLTAKFPKSSPIKSKYKSQFISHANQMLAQLPMAKSQTRLAKRDSGTSAP